MKKRIATLVAIAIVSEVIAIIGVLALFTHVLGNETMANTDDIYKISGYNNINEENADIYNIEADVSFSDNIVTVKETIKLDKTDKTHKTDIINETGYQDGNRFNDTVFLYVPSVNVTKTTIKSIDVEDKYSGPITVRDWKTNDMVLEIQMAPDPLNASDNCLLESPVKDFISIHIEYEIILNKIPGTISYSDNQILLTNFLITPAVYKEDKPILVYNSSFGDPYIYEMNNYRIAFNIDKNIEVYAPGEKEIQDSINDEVQGLKVVFTAKNLRDFPAAIVKNGNLNANIIHVEKVNNTEIYFINSKDAAKYVKEAFLFASKKIGPYPYKKLFVVKASIPLKGMEFSNMIFIADSCFNDKEDFKRVLYHEVLHQWFYGIIGTDQVNEPFMDEGIVNYLAIMLSGNKLGNTYNNKFFDMDLKSYSSKDEYHSLAYIDAAIYFAGIHKKLGDDFYKLLQMIYNEKKFSILYFDEFLQYLSCFMK